MDKGVKGWWPCFFCKKVRARICWQGWKFKSERNWTIYTIKSHMSVLHLIYVLPNMLWKRQGSKCLQLPMDKTIESVLHTQLTKQESCLLMVGNTVAGPRGVTLDCTEDGRTTRQMNPGFPKRLSHQPRLLHEKEKQTNKKKNTKPSILFKPLLFWVFPLQHPNQFSNILGIHTS